MRMAGVILAGGRSSRMDGKDKALALLDGRTMLAHVAAALEPQVEAVLINSNRDPRAFAGLGHPVLADCVPGWRGPLAGLLTGLLWARHCRPGVTHLLSAPCDIPHLPRDIGARLSRALSASGARIAVARDDMGLQPTIGLWPLALTGQLADDLIKRDMRGIQAWLSQFEIAATPCRGLHNINTPGDLLAAGRARDFQGYRKVTLNRGNCSLAGAKPGLSSSDFR